jgi:hypothetical protein
VRALVLLVMSVSCLAAIACGRALEPSNRPVDACAKKCDERVSQKCSESECRRGCEFILDRLVEKETDSVLACIAHGPPVARDAHGVESAQGCADPLWATCAAHVGVHADGGPPPPPPPEEYE